MNELRGAFLIPIKLATAKGLVEGDWFEACHEYNSTGTYKGMMSLDARQLQTFVDNFKAGIVRRWPDGKGKFRLKINYEHWGDTFAGWIVDAKLGEKILSTGKSVKVLYLKAEWLSDAAKAIKNGELTSFSIEYYPDDPLYRDDQTGREYANVLVGGALTNDPFVMEMEPIALSTLVEMRKKALEEKEALNAPIQQTQEADMKLILSALGLSEAASEAEGLKALTAMTSAKADLATKLSVKEAEVVKLTKDVEDQKSLLTAEQAKVKAFEDEKKSALTKVHDDRKASLIKLAIGGDVTKGEKIGKCSKAECEPTGFFGKLLEKDLDLAEEFLTSAKVVGMETNGSSSADGETLTADDVLANRMQELMAADKTLTADGAYQKARTELAVKKEG